jgi:hypothetical protein
MFTVQYVSFQFSSLQKLSPPFQTTVKVKMMSPSLGKNKLILFASISITITFIHTTILLPFNIVATRKGQFENLQTKIKTKT